jgi:drug/metabolite transporter (DMT)-like permease
MHIGANLVSALQCLAPLISAILALFFLGESMTQLEIVGMIVTVVAVTGVVLFHKKDEIGESSVSRKNFAVGIFYSLASAVCHGIGIVMSRQALQEIDIVYGTVARIAPAIIALAIWQNRTKAKIESPVAIWATKKQGLLLTAAAFLGTYCGLILMSLSTKYTKAGVGTALSSTYPIWVIPVARVMTNERSSLVSIMCTVFAVVGIIIMVLGGPHLGFE